MANASTTLCFPKDSPINTAVINSWSPEEQRAVYHVYTVAKKEHFPLSSFDMIIDRGNLNRLGNFVQKIFALFCEYFQARIFPQKAKRWIQWHKEEAMLASRILWNSRTMLEEVIARHSADRTTAQALQIMCLRFDSAMHQACSRPQGLFARLLDFLGHRLQKKEESLTQTPKIDLKSPLPLSTPSVHRSPPQELELSDEDSEYFECEEEHFFQQSSDLEISIPPQNFHQEAELAFHQLAPTSIPPCDDKRLKIAKIGQTEKFQRQAFFLRLSFAHLSPEQIQQLEKKAHAFLQCLTSFLPNASISQSVIASFSALCSRARCEPEQAQKELPRLLNLYDIVIDELVVALLSEIQAPSKMLSTALSTLALFGRKAKQKGVTEGARALIGLARRTHGQNITTDFIFSIAHHLLPCLACSLWAETDTEKHQMCRQMADVLQKYYENFFQLDFSLLDEPPQEAVFLLCLSALDELNSIVHPKKD